jgi:PAS domain S-box-containing protein
MILIAIGVVVFVAQIETAAWRGRQSEVARTAATLIGQVLEDTRDALRFAGLSKRAHLVQQPELFQAMLREESELHELVRLDAEGNLIASAFRDESILAHVFTLAQSVWFQRARAGNFFTSNVQISPQNHPYLIVAMPAPDGGVVAARLTMDVLWQVTAETRFGRAGKIYVTNSAGDIIAHTDPQIVLRRENIGARPELLAIFLAPRNEWQGEFSSLGGEAVVGASAAVPGTDWIVVAELPQDEAFAMTRLAIWLVFGSALIAFYLSNLFERVALKKLILDPLANLRRGTERIGQGDWAYRLPIHARDEIGQVADAFNVMTDRLQERDAQIAARTQSLRMFEQALATMNLGVTITDVEGNILYVNPADARMHGYTAEELIGKSSRIYTTDAPVIARAPDTVKTWSTWQRESVNVRKDGSQFPVQIISDVVRDADGEPRAIIASCFDIVAN